ncbi:MAG: exodeoxyribonuclease V subunit gamma [Opitutales bacterium]
MGAPGLFWHASNRQENLAEALVDYLRTNPRADPLTAETILVPNHGLGRWLTHRIAEGLGVAFNLHLPFVRTYLGDWAADLTGSPRPDSARFFWQVRTALETPAKWGGESMFPAELDDLARTQSAWRLAQLFEEYSLYRGTWLRQWERSAEGPWQGRLWRHLCENQQPATLGAALRRLLESIATGAVDQTPPLARLIVYGVASLPPLVIDLLSWLGRRVPVHLYLLEPTPDFQGDLPARRESQTIHDRTGKKLHLLSALGRLQRDRTNLLVDRNASLEPAGFVEPGEGSLLEALQRSLFLNCAAADRELPADASVQVHASHNPLREVQALRDVLLECFESVDALEPADVLIVTPDLDTYQPLIEAVFASAQPAQRIPLAPYETRPDSRGQCSLALNRLLALAGSRLEAAAVYALMEEPAVAQAAGWTSADLERIRFWIQESRIAWGRDATDRAEAGLPAYAENSWAFGFERLLLGVMMDPDEAIVFAERVPARGAEGLDALKLGEWIAWTERLFAWLATARATHTPSEWARHLQGAVKEFLGGWECAASAEAHSWQAALQRLASADDTALRIDLRTLRYLLGHWVQSGEVGALFRGGVNLSTPARAQGIPARVVVCLGFNDGAFPPRQNYEAADLRERLLEGEPSPRDVDRQSFLELLLNTRERIILSHCGLSTQPDEEAPPSTLIAEVLEALPVSVESIQTISRRHPLLPHSPRYFSTEGLFTYDPSVAVLANARLPDTAPARLWTSDELPTTANAAAVELQTLIAFWRSPAEFFLRQRLGMRLPELTESLPENEPEGTDGLEAYQLRERLLKTLRAEDDPDQAMELLRASGAVAPGEPGRLQLRKLQSEAAATFASHQRLAGSSEAASLEVDLPTARALTGKVYPIYEDVLLDVRAGSVREQDSLAAWIRLLAAVASGGNVTRAIVVGRSGREALSAPEAEDALSYLGGLLKGFAQGQCAPLPFFPATSLAFAKARMSDRQKTDPFTQAELTWRGNYRNEEWAEGNKPAHRLLYGSDFPEQKSFEHWAEAVGGPLIKHRLKRSDD